VFGNVADCYARPGGEMAIADGIDPSSGACAEAASVEVLYKLYDVAGRWVNGLCDVGPLLVGRVANVDRAVGPLHVGGER
jgi:hypothetical protein